MPTEEKMVDLDTSGEGAEINLEEQKDESVVDTEAPKEEAKRLREEGNSLKDTAEILKKKGVKTSKSSLGRKLN